MIKFSTCQLRLWEDCLKSGQREQTVTAYKWIMGASGNVQHEHIEHEAGERQKEVKPGEMVRWEKPGGGAEKTGNTKLISDTAELMKLFSPVKTGYGSTSWDTIGLQGSQYVWGTWIRLLTGSCTVQAALCSGQNPPPSVVTDGGLQLLGEVRVSSKANKLSGAKWEQTFPYTGVCLH